MVLMLDNSCYLSFYCDRYIFNEVVFNANSRVVSFYCVVFITIGNN